MQLCLVESPFRGNEQYTEEQNKTFAKNVCRGLVYEGYNPYASHLFYPQFLDDANPKERGMGINLGLQWGDKATVVFFCLRRGQELSEGMKIGLTRHHMTGKITILRQYDELGLMLLHETELHPQDEEAQHG